MATDLLTIGRLGARGNIEPKTLRYYDRIGLVRPNQRTAAGYRVYGEDALERLDFIRRAKALGMSLADIRRVLSVRDEGAAPCAHVRDLVSKNLIAVETQISRLQAMRADLRLLQKTLRERVPAEAQSAAECRCFAIIRELAKPAVTVRRAEARSGR